MIVDHLIAIAIMVILEIIAILIFVFTDANLIALSAPIAIATFNIIIHLYKIRKIKKEEKGIKPIEWYERKFVSRPLLIVTAALALSAGIFFFLNNNWHSDKIINLVLVYICISVLALSLSGIYHLRKKK